MRPAYSSGRRRFAELPAEGYAECRSAQGKTRAVGGEAVVDVSPNAEDFAPAKGIPEAGDSLPSKFRLTGPQIEIVGHEPRASFTKRPAAFDADDGVPVGDI